jgi:hypothetical protein
MKALLPSPVRRYDTRFSDCTGRRLLRDTAAATLKRRHCYDHAGAFGSGHRILISGGAEVFSPAIRASKAAGCGLWLDVVGAHVAGYALEPPADPSLFEEAALRVRAHTTIGDIRFSIAWPLAVEWIALDVLFHMAAQSRVFPSASSTRACRRSCRCSKNSDRAASP